MTLVAYRESQKIAYNDPSFYAIIMAAMRKADGINLEKLKSVFPETFEELKARYNAPGGCLNQREMDWLQRVLDAENSNDTEDDDNG